MLSRRVILRTLFALPIVLCLAGWLWSSTHLTGVDYGYGDRQVYLWTCGGTLRFQWAVGVAGPGWESINEPFNPPEFWPSKPMWEGQGPSFLGFSYGYLDFPTRPALHSHTFSVPYWFLIVAFGGVFAWVWRKTKPKPDPKTAFPVEVAAVSGASGQAAGNLDEKNPKRESGC